MFLNESKFVAMVKKAYRTKGVHIGNLFGSLVMDMGDVLVVVDMIHMSNRIKALVVELAGGYPKEDQVFYVTKERPHPDEQPKDEVYEKRVKKITDCRYTTKRLQEVPATYTGNNSRLFYDEYTEKIVGIREELVNLISKFAIDYDCESEPTGPAFYLDPKDGIYWYNDIGMIVLLPSAFPEKSATIMAMSHVGHYIEQIKIEEDARRLENELKRAEEKNAQKEYTEEISEETFEESTPVSDDVVQDYVPESINTVSEQECIEEIEYYGINAMRESEPTEVYEEVSYGTQEIYSEG